MENNQNIIFSENEIDVELMNKNTTLKAWFELNSKDNFAKKLLYKSIPIHYEFVKYQWVHRSNPTSKTFGRLICVLPNHRIISF